MKRIENIYCMDGKTLKIFSKGEWLICLFDEQDDNLISKYHWNVSAYGYAITKITINGKRTAIAMHRLVLGLIGIDKESDHINFNKLDNRRVNLRSCTKAENSKNRKPTGWSQYLGVSYTVGAGGRKLIKAQIRSGAEFKYLGLFKTQIEAAKAYDKEAKKLHGEFANLNFK